MTDLLDLVSDPALPADDPVVHWRGTACARGEIAAAVQRVADTLTRMGVAPDSAVAARVPTTPLGVVMVLGIWRAGAVAALLDADLGPDAFDALVADTRPAAVMRASLDAASLVPLVSVHPGEPRRYADDVALVLTAPEPPAPARRVQLTHAAMAAARVAAADTLRARTGGIVAGPVASTTGLDTVLGALAAGEAVDLVDPCTPETVADAVRRRRAEAVTLDAATIDALVDDESVTTIEPLRYIRCIDGAVSAADVRRVRTRFGVTVLAAYGHPEYGGEVVGWTPGDAAVDGDLKPGSVGRPVAGVSVRVLRPDRSAADPGETGEVWVRSPFAMLGLLTDRVAPGPRSDAEGYVHLGDHGHLDRDGFLWIDALPA